MYPSSDLPHDIDMEKDLLSSLLVRNGEIIPAVSAILAPDDFYRPEHQIIFQVILALYAQGIPPNLLSLIEELRKSGDLDKIGHTYIFSIGSMSFTNAYSIYHAHTIKEKADHRRLIHAADTLAFNARQSLHPPVDLIAEHQILLNAIQCSAAPSNKTSFNDYLSGVFRSDVAHIKAYADRKTGFGNLDAQQLLLPGLYVIGATPAAGKTTFCWQLLEQLAKNGEYCIFCSYEMSRLELFAKSFARELFKRDKHTTLSAAQIRRGATSAELERLIDDLASHHIDLDVIELQDESVDDLLKLLKPLCADKENAPVVCLDYLQIMPSTRESTKLGIDDSVRKLKKFQRDTNTTFIVISSFNRMNYLQSVSFESFKESGNIEYTADVVWALQLDIMNRIKGESLSELRRKIDDSKRQQPRHIQLTCLKNRQGTNYDCFFNYHSAHDFFESCTSFDDDGILAPPARNKDRK